MKNLKKDMQAIIQTILPKISPDNTVINGLRDFQLPKGNLYLVAVGKAAYTMALKAEQLLHGHIKDGVVCTKYGHVKNEIPGIRCYEGGHPLVDENGLWATKQILKMTENLQEDDLVLFLLSGGGSALFEDPLISLEELIDINAQLLRSKADIKEINTIRKRLSKVKGGKFAEHCQPAQVYTIVLSDILNDPIDMIASGPTAADQSTYEHAEQIVNKYHLSLSNEAKRCLQIPTIKTVKNSKICIGAGASILAQVVKEACEDLGYHSAILTDQLDCEAREAGRFMGAMAKYNQNCNKKIAYIIAGETTVNVCGKGKGGRNQEMALAAASYLDGMDNVAFFAFGSDGTDGPTDAAGGYVDGNTLNVLNKQGISIEKALIDNDSYHALAKCDGLIITGPTGTNINDVAVLLICEKNNK